MTCIWRGCMVVEGILCVQLMPYEVKCVPNRIIGSKSDPLWHRAVLLLRFGKLLLGTERLVALNHWRSIMSVTWCSFDRVDIEVFAALAHGAQSA